jgi:hypothetical protein
VKRKDCGSPDCEVCKGAGWVWRHELPDTLDWDGSADDTRYTCPYCEEAVDHDIASTADDVLAAINDGAFIAIGGLVS